MKAPCLPPIMGAIALAIMTNALRPSLSPAASASENFVRAMAYTNSVYDKQHLIAIANVEDLTDEKQSYRYDRYPEVERVQEEDGTFARKTGGVWLKSEDWAETGSKVKADKSAELDTFVSLATAPLRKVLTPADKKAERSIAEVRERQPKDGGTEWIIYETRKEKTITMAHPKFVFSRSKGGTDDKSLLIGYAGFIGVGDKSVHVNLNFSVMFRVKIVEANPEPPKADSPAPAKPKEEPAQEEAKALPAPLEGTGYGFMDLLLKRDSLVGKVVQLEIASKVIRTTELRNGLVRATLWDAKKPTPSFGSVDFKKEALESLGLEKGASTSQRTIYVLVEKPPLGAIPIFVAVGAHYSVDKAKYNW